MAIDGDILIGFGDFFSTDDVGAADRGYGSEIGAKKKSAPKAVGKAPTRPYPKVPRKTAMEHHGKVLHGAHAVATKAAQTIGHAMHILSQKPAAHLPPAHPAAKLAGKMVHVGAATATAAAMSPKAKLAVQRHNDAVAKAKKAGQLLAQHAIKTKKSVQVLAKHIVAQKKLAKVMRTKGGAGGKTHVGAFLADPMIGEAVAEALGEYYDAIGAMPDPTNPGYLDDGTPDPAFATTSPAGGAPAGGTPSVDGTATDALASMDVGPLTEDPLDSGATMPPAPPMSQFISDMTAAGGIAYDGSKGTPEGYVLSYGLAVRSTDHKTPDPDTAQIDGTEHWGYVFGKYDLLDPPNGGIKWGSNLSPGAWNHIHGRYHLGDSGWWNPVDASEAFASNSKKSDRGREYGPLVGNPTFKEFAAMRVDAQGNMFWLPQEAPDWLTFPIKQAAALTAQAAKKVADDAAKADAAAAVKTAADNAAAQAAQDAANALAESQAASTAKVAEGEQVTQQAAAETAAQQAIVQQQQAETAQYGVESEQQKQAGALMIQQAQQQAAQDQQVQAMLLQQAQREQGYLAQHPEEEFAPHPLEEGGEAEEGTLESDTMEDGEPLSGADVMQDADGEGFQDTDEE